MLAPSKEMVHQPRLKLVYQDEGPQTQYVVHQTVLGDIALYWTAHWLMGLFSVSDFPQEWVTYVQNAVFGGGREMTDDGDLEKIARQAGPFATLAQALIDGHTALQRYALLE